MSGFYSKMLINIRNLYKKKTEKAHGFNRGMKGR